jgi:hypothetical protein
VPRALICEGGLRRSRQRHGPDRDYRDPLVRRLGLLRSGARPPAETRATQGPIPATCADAKAMPVCTVALQAADTDCYGTANRDCTTATGTEEGSTCATVNLKAGDKMDPAEPDQNLQLRLTTL